VSRESVPDATVVNSYYNFEPEQSD